MRIVNGVLGGFDLGTKSKSAGRWGITRPRHDAQPQKQSQAPAIAATIKVVDAFSTTSKSQPQIVIRRHRSREKNHPIDAAWRERFRRCQNNPASRAMAQEINFLFRMTPTLGGDLLRQPPPFRSDVPFIQLIRRNSPITMGPRNRPDLQ